MATAPDAATVTDDGRGQPAWRCRHAVAACAALGLLVAAAQRPWLAAAFVAAVALVCAVAAAGQARRLGSPPVVAAELLALFVLIAALTLADSGELALVDAGETAVVAWVVGVAATVAWEARGATQAAEAGAQTCDAVV
jgi:hypothetical protein